MVVVEEVAVLVVVGAEGRGGQGGWAASTSMVAVGAGAPK